MSMLVSLEYCNSIMQDCFQIKFGCETLAVFQHSLDSLRQDVSTAFPRTALLPSFSLKDCVASTSSPSPIQMGFIPHLSLLQPSSRDHWVCTTQVTIAKDPSHIAPQGQLHYTCALVIGIHSLQGGMQYHFWL